MASWRIAVICLVLLCSSGCGFAPGATAPVADTNTLLSERVPNPRAYGDPNAPVKIIEFSDFQ